MSKTLKLKFSNDLGKNFSLNIPYINNNVTSDQVKTLGTDIISRAIFSSDGGTLKKLSSAELVNTETTNMLQ